MKSDFLQKTDQTSKSAPFRKTVLLLFATTLTPTAVVDTHAHFLPLPWHPTAEVHTLLTPLLAFELSAMS